MSHIQLILSRTIVSAISLALLFIGASTVFAATDTASTNESFTQGLQKDGDAVPLSRSNPANALGTPDGSYVSLGYAGELIVGFDQSMAGNLSLTIQEVTSGPYPLETADVWVSTDSTGPWTYVGEASNDDGTGDAITTFSVDQCYQYVRVVDTTDSDLHDDNSDGFDVDAFTAEFDGTCPEESEPPMTSPNRAHLWLHNSSMVINETETLANTGGNTADGSYGGFGGDGGAIENHGNTQDIEAGSTGNGGTGGDAGLGGAVQTGNASAVTSITNQANRNIIGIDSCDCESTYDRIRIRTHDFAFLMNRTGTAANTGDNAALGSYAGDGGLGGDIENGTHEQSPLMANGYSNNDHDTDDVEQELDNISTGTGGNGGAGEAGGSVLTGTSTARATIVNLTNSNRIRIR